MVHLHVWMGGGIHFAIKPHRFLVTWQQPHNTVPSCPGCRSLPATPSWELSAVQTPVLVALLLYPARSSPFCCPWAPLWPCCCTETGSAAWHFTCLSRPRLVSITLFGHASIEPFDTMPANAPVQHLCCYLLLFLFARFNSPLPGKSITEQCAKSAQNVNGFCPNLDCHQRCAAHC